MDVWWTLWVCVELSCCRHQSLLVSARVYREAAVPAPPIIVVCGKSGRRVLGRDAPRQVIVTVVPSGIVKEIAPG